MNAYRDRYELLIRANVGAEAADRHARQLHPDAAAEWDKASSAEAQRNANIAEDREQSVIMKMARAIGIRAWNNSQKRRSKVAPGIPDIMFSKRDVKFFAFWETKRQVGGKASEEQLVFAGDVEAAGVNYGRGDRYHFAEFLKAHGFTPPPIPQD